ncbi:MAG: tetratricopeptide repeat protein, partial [Nitrospira sp.]|nr:tetratricopeptide repeat protein [Nitrospira sp.]
FYDSPEIQYNVGLAHHNLGNYKEAIETYKNVLQSKPDWTGVHYNLGEAYLALGNRIDAFDQYMILKNLDSDLAHKLYRLFNLYNLDVCLGNA